MADVSIVIGAKDDASPTIKKVADNVGEIEKKSGGAAKALGDVAKIASGFVVAQGLMKLPGLLTGFVGGASDLNESLSKVNTVFGANAKEIENWASTAAKNLGMSKGAALEAAGTFGNFLQAMGATTPAATSMSKSMVQLATDLGSFNNADPTEVLLALRSGLSGEAEPLRKFGVALSEAAVKAKAAQMGIGTLGKELTEQEKIQARYAIIMEQTTMAQGDFERTSGGLANQTKILKASFKDASDQLGTALLPAVVSVMGALIQLLPFVISVGEALGGKLMEGIKSVVGVMADFWKYIKFVNDEGDTMNDWLSHLPGWLQPAAKFAGELIEPLKALAGITWEALTDLASLTWDGLTALASLAWDAFEDAWAVVGPLLEKAAALAWGQLIELSKASWDRMATAWVTISDAASRFPWGRMKDEASDTNNWANAWDALKQKLAPAVAILEPLVKDILAQLRNHLTVIKDGLKDNAEAFRELWEALKPIHPLLEAIGKLLGITLVGAIAFLLVSIDLIVRAINLTFLVAFAALELAIKSLAVAIEAVTTVFTEWPQKIGHALGDVGKTIQANVDKFIEILNSLGLIDLSKLLYEVGKDVVQGFLDGIYAMGDKIAEAGGWIGGKIKDAVTGILQVHSPSKVFEEIGTNLMEGLVMGMVNELPVLLDAVTGIVKAVWDRTTSAWKAATGSAKDFTIGPAFAQSITTDMMEGVTKGVAASKPLVKQALQSFGQEIVTDMQRTAPLVANASAHMAQAIIDAMKANLESGTALDRIGLGELLQSMSDLIMNNPLPDAARQLAEQTITGWAIALGAGEGLANQSVIEFMENLRNTILREGEKVAAAMAQATSVVPGMGGAASSYILGSDGKWYPNEGAMPPGVTGASTSTVDPRSPSKDGTMTSYIGGGQNIGLAQMPKVGDIGPNGSVWNGSYYSQNGAGYIPTDYTGMTGGSASPTTTSNYTVNVTVQGDGDAGKIKSVIEQMLTTEALTFGVVN